MSVSVQLRLIPAPVAQPVKAGYLPGSEVAAWLTEMARHADARFFVVPDSVEQAEAGGLLILPADTTATVSFGPRVIPCGLEHGCVAVPLTTRLDPLLTADEVKRLLTYAVYFFHPSLGLVAFDETDAIQARQLIVPPLPKGGSWMEALPGRMEPPRLNRIMLALPEDPGDLFGEAANDIGSASPKDLLDQDSPLKRLGGKLMLGAAGIGVGVLGGLAKMLGAGKGGKEAGAGAGGSRGAGDRNTRGIPLLEQLGRWTAKQLENLQRKRESEISRLLEMLEKDPEKGLRHAVPFGGDASRGMAPPSGRLGEREPVFGRGGRSGGPADVWNFSDQAKFELQKKYRDLAAREMAEKRFDRAAYIFAELLGDWHAAAGALMRGRRFQEAARIYQDRLSNKSLAAKCLEEGGLLQDAVLLYAELGQHEKCGDLLRKLGCEREAVAAYHQAMKGQTDRLHDARILFDKLGQHGLAIAVLAGGYPATPQARACLEKHFEYLGRLNAHDDAHALALGLAQPDRQMPQPLTLVQALHAVHSTYPAPEVRNRLGTVAVGVIGSALSRKVDNEKALLELLPQFVPADRLLRRDANRYHDCRAHERKALPWNPAPAEPGQKLHRKRTFKLPQDGTEWRCLISHGDRWLATGHHVKMAQDVWAAGEGEKISGKLTSSIGWASQLPLPALLPPLPGVAWIPLARKDEPPRYGQTKGSDFSFVPNSRERLLAALSWMPSGVLAVHPVADGTWILHRNVTETLDLSFYSYEGRLIRTHALGWAQQEMGGSLSMIVHDEEVVIAIDTRLVFVKHGHAYHEVDLEMAASDIQVSRPVQPAALLVTTCGEAMVMGPGKKSETVQLFSREDGLPPVSCFLADGRITVGDESGLLIYSAYPHTKLISRVPLSKGANLAVADITAWGDHGLAVLWRDGVIECYE